MTSMATAARFGEVVEASIERLLGQCHELYAAPVLGTLVRAGESVSAVVEGVETVALDPTRPIVARGAGAASEAEVYAEHPQLERLLRTQVTLSVIGHREGPDVRQYLPPLPPRIHTFLHVCPAEEVREFFASGRPDFASLLIRRGVPAGDDVLAAVLRQASAAFEEPGDFLLAASRGVASLLAGDTARLNAIVRRLPLGA